MILKAQQYNLKATYKSGKDIPKADLLSCKCVEGHSAKEEKNLEEQVRMVLQHLPATRNKLEETGQKTERD